MANDENLIPQNKRTKSEQRRIAQLGGKKSGESRREKKIMRDSLKLVMSLKEKDLDFLALMEKYGIPKTDRDWATSVNIKLAEEARDGNVSAYLAIRDTLGEKPTDKTENQNVNTFRIEFVDAGIDPIEEEEQ